MSCVDLIWEACRAEVDAPAIQIKFAHLSARAVIKVGDRAVPTLLSSFTGSLLSVLARSRLSKSSEQHFGVLKDVSGVLKPVSPQLTALA